MPKGRKTIDVAPLQDKLQRAMILNLDDTVKLGALNWAMETLLMDSGNYRGFYFLDGEGNHLPHEEAAALDPDDPGYQRRWYYKRR